MTTSRGDGLSATASCSAAGPSCRACSELLLHPRGITLSASRSVPVRHEYHICVAPFFPEEHEAGGADRNVCPTGSAGGYDRPHRPVPSRSAKNSRRPRRAYAGNKMAPEEVKNCVRESAPGAGRQEGGPNVLCARPSPGGGPLEEQHRRVRFEQVALPHLD